MLLEKGHSVRVLVRSEIQEARLGRLGVGTIHGDILEAETLLRLASGSDVVLHLATAIPREGSDATWEMNDRIRREGTRNLLDATIRGHAKRYIQQSITLLYGESGDSVVTESSPIRPPAFVQSAADMEAEVQSSPLDWCILRGGLFYGIGTGTDAAWLAAARQGKLRFAGDGSAFISLIHVSDMARAIVTATEAAPARSTFNVVDNEPVRSLDLFTYVAALVEGPPPEAGGDGTLPSLRCSNAAIRSGLDWEPAFPSYRSGLALTTAASA
jgi:nucleoside-diphosphate-sugar epimerase